MSIAFYRSTVDQAYMQRKGRAWVVDYIGDLQVALGDPPMTHEERQRLKIEHSSVAITKALALQRRLPAGPERLRVGTRVDRDDGRFYIPITQGDSIVARVASDAFDEDEGRAGAFAVVLCAAYNLFET